MCMKHETHRCNTQNVKFSKVSLMFLCQRTFRAKLTVSEFSPAADATARKEKEEKKKHILKQSALPSSQM